MVWSDQVELAKNVPVLRGSFVQRGEIAGHVSSIRRVATHPVQPQQPHQAVHPLRQLHRVEQRQQHVFQCRLCAGKQFAKLKNAQLHAHARPECGQVCLWRLLGLLPNLLIHFFFLKHTIFLFKLYF